MSLSRLSLVLVIIPALAACDLPRDPGHTLSRVEGKTLRVGVSTNSPWTETELDLVNALAADLHAKPVFIAGAESSLIHRLEAHELDLVAGGLETSTPWKKNIGLTRPYPGGDEKHVLAVPAGENAFLLRIDQLIEARDIR